MIIIFFYIVGSIGFHNFTFIKLLINDFIKNKKSNMRIKKYTFIFPQEVMIEILKITDIFTLYTLLTINEIKSLIENYNLLPNMSRDVIYNTKLFRMIHEMKKDNEKYNEYYNELKKRNINIMMEGLDDFKKQLYTKNYKYLFTIYMFRYEEERRKKELDNYIFIILKYEKYTLQINIPITKKSDLITVLYINRRIIEKKINIKNLNSGELSSVINPTLGDIINIIIYFKDKINNDYYNL